jgi:DNA polymerase III subunit beta
MAGITVTGEFTVEQKALAEALTLATTAVEKKTTIPVLTHVLVEATAGLVTFAATDLELGIRCSCRAEVKKAGVCAIPAKKLFDYVRLLAAGPVQVRMFEDSWVGLSSGRGRMRVAGMSRANFPEMPAMPELIVEIPAGKLALLVTRTAFAVSTEESRFTVGGALLLLEPGSIAMVTTDGHRLAYARAPLDGVERSYRAIVPKKALSELVKVMAGGSADDAIGFGADDNHLHFEIGSRHLFARRLTGNFPDYERVLPAGDAAVSTEFRTEELRAALERAMLFADGTSHAVRVEFAAGETRIFASSTDGGECEEAVSSEGGAALEIGFNARYLLDFLAASGAERVVLGARDAKADGELRALGDDSYRYVVMPLRI